MFSSFDYTPTVQAIQQATKVNNLVIQLTENASGTFADVSLSVPNVGQRKFRLPSQPSRITPVVISYLRHLTYLQDFELEQRWNALCYRDWITPYACRQIEKRLLVTFDSHVSYFFDSEIEIRMREYGLQKLQDVSYTDDWLRTWLITSL
jgi:hypothetical protein